MRDDVVDSVEETSGDPREHAADGTREPHRLEQLHAACAVADEGSVPLRKAPRGEPLFFDQPVEKGRGLGIAQRKVGQLIPAVE